MDCFKRRQAQVSCQSKIGSKAGQHLPAKLEQYRQVFRGEPLFVFQRAERRFGPF